MKPVFVLGLVGIAIAALFFVLIQPVDPTEPGGIDDGPAVTASGDPGGSRTTDIDLTDEPATEANRIESAPIVPDRAAVVGADGEYTGSYNNGIDGIVLDANDQPLADVKLTLIKHRMASQFAPIEAAFNQQAGVQREAWSAVSDASGKFRFSSLEPSLDYAVVAEHESFSRTERTGFKVSAEGDTLVMVKMRTGYILQGIIMDDLTGLPIAGADLILQSVFALLPGASSEGELTATTDDQGRYRLLNVSGGTRNLTVTAPGYGSRTRNNLLFSGSPLEPVNQDFRLAEGLCLRGRVVAPDRTPIAEVSIEATSYETAQVSRGSARSDENGYFEICDLAEGTFMVIARVPGFSDQRLTRVQLSDPDLQIVMSRQGGVIGTVVSAADQQPVTDFRAMVRAVAPGSAVYGRTVSQSKFSDPEGRFELGGLEPGSYVVQAESPGFAPTYSETFVVSQGIVTADVRVELGQGGAIAGRVVDQSTGEPLRGAKVSTFDNGYIENPFTQMLGGLVPRTTTDRKVKTDADGNFRIDKLTAATYQIQIDHADYPRVQLKDIQVREGTTTDKATIRLRKGATIRGVVYDAAGSPLADARVSLASNQQIQYPNQIRTDAEGRFVINNVEAGSWTMSAVRPISEAEGNPFGPIIDMKKSEVTIMVSAGQELTQNLTIGN